MEVSVLPKTFQDAIMITTRLGVNYLWIDALCIIQDSPDAAEWRHEASLMGDIYANSYVTLAATTSENSDGGLLHRRNPLSIWPCRVDASWTCFQPSKLVISVGKWGGQRDMKPLEDRAWAFQEWLLSKRLIHFSYDQVRWECYCLAASQVYPGGLYPDGLDQDMLDEHGLTTKSIVALLSDSDEESPDVLWSRIRQEYSEKLLTKAADKLAAFSGVARMAHKVLKSAPEEYCVGLWKPELLPELLWERRGAETAKRSSGVYIAPTWSWASLNGGFWQPSIVVAVDLWLVETVDTRIQYIQDVFGPVRAGSILLRCDLYPIVLTVVQRDPKYFSTEFHWELTQLNGRSMKCGSTAVLDYHDPKDSKLSSDFGCHFMPMVEERRDHGPEFNLRGMLLKPTGHSRGQYYRIGVLRVYGSKETPSFINLMVQERDTVPEGLYISDQEAGHRTIEIV